MLMCGPRFFNWGPGFDSMAKQMLNRRLGLSVDSLGGVLNLIEQRARHRSAQGVSPERLIREILVSEGWMDH